jgi:hypothetical protein
LLLLGGLFLLALVAGTITRAELTDEQKRELFLKSREQMRTIASPTPEESTTPRPKPKPAKHPPAKKKKSSAPKPTPEPEEKPARTPRPQGEETPARSAQPVETPSQRPTPSESTPPRAVVAKPAATAAPAQVVIKKSGYQKPRGFSLPFHLFGRHYDYLTRSVRNEIDRAPVLRERWRFIIVHNSGTRQGNARIFDYYHRHVRHMTNGLAYHFVIGNGSGAADGAVEVGYRWRDQIAGPHTKNQDVNLESIAICLVGDLEKEAPTKKQIAALLPLLERLCREGGIPAERVRSHREVDPETLCPGRGLPIAAIREALARQLAPLGAPSAR